MGFFAASYPATPRQFKKCDKEHWGMNKKLYVGNLPYSVTERDLRELFEQAGEVTAIRRVFHRSSNLVLLRAQL